jgi:hypothetical protein
MQQLHKLVRVAQAIDELIRNIADLDDKWLAAGNIQLLRHTFREFREAARDILGCQS